MAHLTNRSSQRLIGAIIQEPNAISNAIGYAKFFSRSHDAVIPLAVRAAVGAIALLFSLPIAEITAPVSVNVFRDSRYAGERIERALR